VKQSIVKMLFFNNKFMYSSYAWKRICLFEFGQKPTIVLMNAISPVPFNQSKYRGKELTKSLMSWRIWGKYWSVWGLTWRPLITTWTVSAWSGQRDLVNGLNLPLGSKCLSLKGLIMNLAYKQYAFSQADHRETRIKVSITFCVCLGSGVI